MTGSETNGGKAMSARDMAEQQVADMLGVTVAKVQANQRAEVAHAEARGVPERVGATYRMVQDRLYANLRGE